MKHAFLTSYVALSMLAAPLLLSCQNVLPEKESVARHTAEVGKKSRTAILPADYRNYYGIAWRGTAHENLQYARQMKHDYVFYQAGMENDTLSNGLYFYMESPEYRVYSRSITTTASYTSAQKTFFQTHYSLKSAVDSFPNNIATGWFFSSTNFTPILDFQQQSVITYAVDSIMNIVQGIESRNPNFHFGGMAWDVPNLPGDFWSAPGGSQITLSYWTGGDYGAIYPGTTHNYGTYTAGHVEFYRQLYERLRTDYPDAKFLMEPSNLYTGWVNVINNTPGAADIMPDMLSQEGSGLEFATDSLIFASGLITRDRVGSSTPNKFGEADNRLIAARAAINGSWYNWFGRFGGSGDMPNYTSITEVPGRLKLIRVLPCWENVNETPLTGRSWNGTTYESATAFADPKTISVIQPGTSKLFVIFHASDGEAPIPTGYTIGGVQKTNSLLIENGDGSADLLISGGKIKPASTSAVDKVYILTLN